MQDFASTCFRRPNVCRYPDTKFDEESPRRDVGRRVRRRKATGRLVGLSGDRCRNTTVSNSVVVTVNATPVGSILYESGFRSSPVVKFSLLNQNESKHRFLQCASDAGFASLRSCRFRDKSGEWLRQRVVADIMSTSRFQLHRTV